MRYSCRLDLDGDAAESLDNLRELENAFALIWEVERKMKIDDGSMLMETCQNLRGNLALPGNLKSFWDMRVCGTEVHWHMVLGLYIGEHHPGEHVATLRFGSYDLTEKVVPIRPGSGNADD